MRVEPVKKLGEVLKDLSGVAFLTNPDQDDIIEKINEIIDEINSIKEEIADIWSRAADTYYK